MRKVIPYWTASIYRNRISHIRVICAATREDLCAKHHIQYADARQGYYVHAFEKSGQIKRELVERPIIIQDLLQQTSQKEVWKDRKP